MMAEWKEISIKKVCKEIYRYPTFYGMEKHSQGVPVVRGEHILPNGTISTEWAKYWFVSKEGLRGQVSILDNSVIQALATEFVPQP